MPKFVRTVVKKSSLVPWITGEEGQVLKSNSPFLSEIEQQLYAEARVEVQNFPGYIKQETISIGNTQIQSYEFDTIENLNDFVDKTLKTESSSYQPELKHSLLHKLVAEKIKELGLSDSYQVSFSTEA